MSSDEQSDKECPLCMEAFDIDDFNFYPCNCQYQICRFCWHRIRTNENGLCPACRQSYPEDPVNFQPFSSAELQKIKSEKKQKIQQQKNKVVESRKHLSEFRVLQKNLVYAVGLSQRMADPELLKKPEFFGKFGRIIKVAVGTAQAINNSTPPTHTSYVTYARSEDALRAIQAVNNMVVDGRLLKASLGTTKYCSNFLKGQACYKPECMYLHEVAEEETSFTKEDMHQGKHTEYERRLHDQMMAVLGQQSNSAAGTQQQKEMLKNKTNRIAENFNEKKRQATGSTENLVKTAQQKQKKGSAGNIGVSTAATTSGSTKCGWDEQKMSGTATTTTRGGSETRELRRNESAQAMVSDVKRNSKASVKSVSPPTISSAGLEDRSANSSSNNIAALNTSPISMYSMADQPHQQQQQLVRSESNPPLMAASSVPSPSPPMMIPTAEMNDIGDEDTTLVMVAAAATDSNSMQLDIVQEPEEKTLPPKSANSTINFFLDQDDGDLGFDPFAESARELEKIMEEEKQNMPSAADASSLTSHQHNGFGSASSASINNYFSNNNTSTLFNHNHQPHPPGLHPAFSGNSGLHSNNFDGGDGPSGFSSMFGSNKMMNSSERSIANSMSDLRESFKAMLPNVNVRFMSDSNSQLQQQQQPLTHQSHQHHNFGGFFDNSSTSSLPALPSGGQMRTAASNHLRQFGLEHPQQQQPHPSLFQQRIHHLQQQQQMQTQNHNHMAQNHHHPFQSMGSYGNGSNNTNGPFSGGMQQQQHQMAHQQQQSQPSQQSQYSQQQSTTAAAAAALHRQQTSSSNHTHPFQSLQQQHFAMPPLQQQQQHNSGGAGPFGSQSIEQQQQTGSGGGSSSWLPVPPGFSPR